ncbi:MAG TPA: phosphohistidine phosphatase SixA [Blastocatellia bacterium]|nr:phosphohistidine phosphatase SixA [Blastocatellia bacterium]
MDLYIIRHAIAQQLDKKNDFTDEKRDLTSEGRERMREAAKGLRKLDVELDLILTSPLVRAVETAEIVAAALGLSKKEIVQTDNLKPGASIDRLFSEIKKHAGVESLALVGHQPDLGEIVSRVAQGNGNLSIALKKGGVCLINVIETVPTLHGNLMWLVTPKQLRLLAKS